MPKVPPKEGRMTKGCAPRNPRGSSAKVRVRKAARELIKDLGSAVDAEGRLLEPKDIARIISRIMFGSTSMVRDMGQDDSNFGSQYAARLAEHGMTNNDLVIFRTLWEMVIGKPKERTSMELTGKDGAPVEIKSKSELLEHAMMLRRQVDELGEE